MLKNTTLNYQELCKSLEKIKYKNEKGHPIVWGLHYFGVLQL